MTKWTLTLAIIFSALILGSIFHQRHALACHTAGLLDYQAIAHNVYVRQFDGDISELVREARERITENYGALSSSPTIVFADNVDEAIRFGANDYGRAHLGPLGECIVVGPKGKNVDVVAHELMHAEVHNRTGWWQHLWQVPIWFNEGIALTVDHRAPYLPQNISLADEQVEAVKRLKSDFFTSGNIQQNYQAARVAVTPIDPSQLYQQLAKLNQGESFSSVFGFLN